MATFEMKTTADTMNMISGSLKHKVGLSFLAIDEYGSSYMITYTGGVIAIENKYDSYEYAEVDFIETSSGKFLAIANDADVVLALTKLDKMKEE